MPVESLEPLFQGCTLFPSGGVEPERRVAGSAGAGIGGRVGQSPTTESGCRRLPTGSHAIDIRRVCEIVPKKKGIVIDGETGEEFAGCTTLQGGPVKRIPGARIVAQCFSMVCESGAFRLRGNCFPALRGVGLEFEAGCGDFLYVTMSG